jgi:hypothetical protein
MEPPYIEDDCGFSSEEAPTSPPDPELEPIEDPAHQKMVRRLEKGVSRRFDNVQSRLVALEKLAESQEHNIVQLSLEIANGNREARETRGKMLEAFERYANNATDCVTRLGQLSTRIENIEHEHKRNHPNTSMPPKI